MNEIAGGVVACILLLACVLAMTATLYCFYAVLIAGLPVFETVVLSLVTLVALALLLAMSSIVVTTMMGR